MGTWFEEPKWSYFRLFEEQLGVTVLHRYEDGQVIVYEVTVRGKTHTITGKTDKPSSVYRVQAMVMKVICA